MTTLAVGSYLEVQVYLWYVALHYSVIHFLTFRIPGSWRMRQRGPLLEVDFLVDFFSIAS